MSKIIVIKLLPLLILVQLEKFNQFGKELKLSKHTADARQEHTDLLAKKTSETHVLVVNNIIQLMPHWAQITFLNAQTQFLIYLSVQLILNGIK